MQLGGIYIQPGRFLTGKDCLPFEHSIEATYELSHRFNTKEASTFIGVPNFLFFLFLLPAHVSFLALNQDRVFPWKLEMLCKENVYDAWRLS